MPYFSNLLTKDLDLIEMKLIIESISDRTAYRFENKHIRGNKSTYTFSLIENNDEDTSKANIIFKRIYSLLPAVTISEIRKRFRNLYENNSLTEVEYNSLLNSDGLNFMLNFLLFCYDDYFTEAFNSRANKNDKSGYALKAELVPVPESFEYYEGTELQYKSDIVDKPRIDDEFIKLLMAKVRDCYMEVKEVGIGKYYFRNPSTQDAIHKKVMGILKTPLAKSDTNPFPKIMSMLEDDIVKSTNAMSLADNESRPLAKYFNGSVDKSLSRMHKELSSYLLSSNTHQDAEGNEESSNDIMRIDIDAQEEIGNFKDIMIALHEFSNEYLSLKNAGIIADPIQWKKEIQLMNLVDIINSRNSKVRDSSPRELHDKFIVDLNNVRITNEGRKKGVFETAPYMNLVTKDAVKRSTDISIDTLTVDQQVRERIMRFFTFLNTVHLAGDTLSLKTFSQLKSKLIDQDASMSHTSSNHQMLQRRSSETDEDYNNRADKFVLKLIDIVSKVNQLENMLERLGITLLEFPSEIVRNSNLIFKYDSLKMYLKYSNRTIVDPTISNKLTDYFNAPVYDDGLTDQQVYQSMLYQFNQSSGAKATQEEIERIAKYNILPASDFSIDTLQTVSKPKKKVIKIDTGDFAQGLRYHQEMIDSLRYGAPLTDRDLTAMYATLGIANNKFLTTSGGLLTNINLMDKNQLIDEHADKMTTNYSTFQASIFAFIKGLHALMSRVNRTYDLIQTDPEQISRALVAIDGYMIPQARHEKIKEVMVRACITATQQNDIYSLESLADSSTNNTTVKLIVNTFIKFICKVGIFVVDNVEGGKPLTDMYSKLGIEVPDKHFELPIQLFSGFTRKLIEVYTNLWFEENADRLDPESKYLHQDNYALRIKIYSDIVRFAGLLNEQKDKLIEEMTTRKFIQWTYDENNNPIIVGNVLDTSKMSELQISRDGRQVLPYLTELKKIEIEVDSYKQESGVTNDRLLKTMNTLNQNVGTVGLMLPAMKGEESLMSIVNYKASILTLRFLLTKELVSAGSDLLIKLNRLDKATETFLDLNVAKKIDDQELYNNNKEALTAMSQLIQEKGKSMISSLTSSVNSEEVLRTIRLNRNIDGLGYLMEANKYVMKVDYDSVSFLHTKGYVVRISKSNSEKVLSLKEDDRQDLMEKSNTVTDSLSLGVSLENIVNKDSNDVNYGWIFN